MDSRWVDFDTWLDERLRAATPPDGLFDRLRAIPAEESEAVDRALCSVPLPAGLTERLQAIALEGNPDVERRLREVPVPRGLLVRLLRISGGTSWQIRLARTALAASVLIAAWIGAMGALVGVLVKVYGPESGVDSIGLADYPLDPIQAMLPAIQEPRPADPLAAWLEPGEGELESSERLVGLRSFEEPVKLSLARTAPAPEERRGEVGGFPAEWMLGWNVCGGGRQDPFGEWGIGEWPYAVHHTFDDMPDLKRVTPVAPRGIDASLAPGFDLPFLLRTGVHPFVSPAKHPKLQTSSAPLNITPAGYESARRAIERGEWPTASSIRTEDFLAAMDFGFAPPKQGPLALAAIGGASPFGGEALRLSHGGDALRMLLIGVQARDAARPERTPVHVTFALDVSASMAWGGRLDTACRAMTRFVEQLEPYDRVALVAFNETASPIAADVGRFDAEALGAALSRLRAGGSTNVADGLRAAYSAALHDSAAGVQRYVVLVTDGLAELTPAASELIEQRLADGASQGVRLNVIDLGRDIPVGLNVRQLDRFAAAGAGRVRQAGNSDQVGWALAEMISGKPQLVAKDVSFKVTFNPAVVTEYRLLGHEASAVAGLRPAALAADFCARQSGAALYELRLKPTGEGPVATIELSWLDPKTGQRAKLTQTVTRGQMPGGLNRTPAELQMAAFAAELAELLRDSPYARMTPRPGSVGRLVEFATNIDSRLMARPSFMAMADTARRLEKVRPPIRGAVR